MGPNTIRLMRRTLRLSEYSLDVLLGIPTGTIAACEDGREKLPCASTWKLRRYVRKVEQEREVHWPEAPRRREDVRAIKIRIRSIRRKLRKSVAWMGRHLWMSPTSYKRWEGSGNRINAWQLLAAANALHVVPEYLCDKALSQSAIASILADAIISKTPEGEPMIVVSRLAGEQVQVDGPCTITVLDPTKKWGKSRARLGFTGPLTTNVLRVGTDRPLKWEPSDFEPRRGPGPWPTKADSNDEEFPNED